MCLLLSHWEWLLWLVCKLVNDGRYDSLRSRFYESPTFLALAPTLASGAIPSRRNVISRHDVHLVPSMSTRPSRSAMASSPLRWMSQDCNRCLSCTSAPSRSARNRNGGGTVFHVPIICERRELRLEMFESHGRQVGYATSSKGQEALFNWLRENPHRLNLARIGFILDGRPITQRCPYGDRSKAGAVGRMDRQPV